MNAALSEKSKYYAPMVLRLGMSILFLWFGSQQLFHTSMWTSLIPEWIISLSGLTAATMVHINGAFEIVFGICLLFGYFTRTTALLLALHLLDITFTVGYSSIGVRDFALSMAIVSVFLHGMDAWSLDAFLARKENL